MKRGLVAVGVFLGSTSIAMAASPNSVGCGLGSQLFDGQSGIFPQVLAVTTNGTLGNQTFGITSGTLGCNPDGTVVASARIPMFVGANIDSLARDMAIGDGEALASLAALLGIQDGHKAVFYRAAKTNYGRIFAHDQVTSGEVLNSLYGVMRETESLARYVPV